jgi:hypothetical protein
MRAGPRRGFVLVLTLLLLLAVTLLAHGLLVLAQTHRRAGTTAWAARARGWTAVSLAGHAAHTLDSLPHRSVVRSVVVPDGSARVVVQILSPELGLVRSEVDWQGRSRAGGLVWALDPAMRIASLPRAAEVGRWPDAETWGRLEVGPAFEPEGCPLDTLPGAGTRAAVAIRDPSASLAPGEAPGLGLLAGPDLAAALTPLDGPVGTPMPDLDGDTCRDAAWNWGDPAGPPALCGGRWLAGWWPGSLRVEGGVGQGVIAVGGDLTLDGAHLRGLLLVGGDLELEGATRFEGVARVGGELRVGGEARFRGRPCDAHAALEAASGSHALRAPRVVRRPGWVLH